MTLWSYVNKILMRIQFILGLTKEFYETFWNEIKNPFMNSIIEVREKKKLSTSSRN